MGNVTAKWEVQEMATIHIQLSVIQTLHNSECNSQYMWCHWPNYIGFLLLFVMWLYFTQGKANLLKPFAKISPILLNVWTKIHIWLRVRYPEAFSEWVYWYSGFRYKNCLSWCVISFDLIEICNLCRFLFLLL